jgi:uncharacterized membrane protein YfcA
MPETMQLIWMGLALLVIGAFAGVLAGLLGVGGGIVLVPAFYYVFTALGYDGPQVMQICLATSLATMIVTSSKSLQTHNRKGAVEWPNLRTWAPGIILGAILGVVMVAQLKTATLTMIFAVLALLVSAWMLLGNSAWRVAQTMPKGPLRAALSSVVGFLSVLMGIGGGSFGVPVMTLFGVPIHRAVATASGFGLLIALPSVALFLFLNVESAGHPPYTIGAINLPSFVLTIAATLNTTKLGANLAHKMDPKPLRRIFAVFLCFVALNMLRKALGY